MMRNLIACLVEDRPGVLARIATVFGNHEISISSAIQPETSAGVNRRICLMSNGSTSRGSPKGTIGSEKRAVTCRTPFTVPCGEKSSMRAVSAPAGACGRNAANAPSRKQRKTLTDTLCFLVAKGSIFLSEPTCLTELRARPSVAGLDIVDHQVFSGVVSANARNGQEHGHDSDDQRSC